MIEDSADPFELLLAATKTNAEIQRQFDAAVDARDMPSGATKQPEPYTGD